VSDEPSPLKYSDICLLIVEFLGPRSCCTAEITDLPILNGKVTVFYFLLLALCPGEITARDILGDKASLNGLFHWYEIFTEL